MTRLDAETIWTIGHSTRALDEFIALLREHGIEVLADVRRFPQSRRHPHFSREALAHSLEEAGIRYRHFESLGGMRKPEKRETNAGWRNAAFRGYADYMASAEFEQALRELIAAAQERRTAILCAEAVPWRCHRMLISDALAARGWKVEHILAPAGKGTGTKPHAITDGARVEGTSVTYPALQLPLPDVE